MITTRRAIDGANVSFGQEKGNSNEGLVDRPVVECSTNVATNEELNDARIKMQKNLEKLLNYDRYSTVVEDKALDVASVAPVEEVVEQANFVSATTEDSIPSSTTMQFSSEYKEEIETEINQTKREEKVSYKLNARGKLLVSLYALAVVVILALIMLNTGVLANLKTRNASAQSQMTSIEQELNDIRGEIHSMSTEEHIISEAEKMGMIK